MSVMDDRARQPALKRRRVSENAVRKRQSYGRLPETNNAHRPGRSSYHRSSQNRNESYHEEWEGDAYDGNFSRQAPRFRPREARHRTYRPQFHDRSSGQLHDQSSGSKPYNNFNRSNRRDRPIPQGATAPEDIPAASYGRFAGAAPPQSFVPSSQREPPAANMPRLVTLRANHPEKGPNIQGRGTYAKGTNGRVIQSERRPADVNHGASTLIEGQGTHVGVYSETRMAKHFPASAGAANFKDAYGTPPDSESVAIAIGNFNKKAWSIGPVHLPSSCLKQLDTSGLLDDAVLDFFFNFIEHYNLPQHFRDRVFLFNSYFYVKLLKGGNTRRSRHAAVARWTNRLRSVRDSVSTALRCPIAMQQIRGDNGTGGGLQSFDAQGENSYHVSEVATMSASEDATSRRPDQLQSARHFASSEHIGRNILSDSAPAPVIARQHIWEFDVVVIPLNLHGAHWTLAIVCYPLLALRAPASKASEQFLIKKPGADVSEQRRNPPSNSYGKTGPMSTLQQEVAILQTEKERLRDTGSPPNTPPAIVSRQPHCDSAINLRRSISRAAFSLGPSEEFRRHSLPAQLDVAASEYLACGDLTQRLTACKLLPRHENQQQLHAAARGRNSHFVDDMQLYKTRMPEDIERLASAAQTPRRNRAVSLPRLRSGTDRRVASAIMFRCCAKLSSRSMRGAIVSLVDKDTDPEHAVHFERTVCCPTDQTINDVQDSEDDADCVEISDDEDHSKKLLAASIKASDTSRNRSARSSSDSTSRQSDLDVRPSNTVDGTSQSQRFRSSFKKKRSLSNACPNNDTGRERISPAAASASISITHYIAEAVNNAAQVPDEKNKEGILKCALDHVKRFFERNNTSKGEAAFVGDPKDSSTRASNEGAIPLEFQGLNCDLQNLLKDLLPVNRPGIFLLDSLSLRQDLVEGHSANVFRNVKKEASPDAEQTPSENSNTIPPAGLASKHAASVCAYGPLHRTLVDYFIEEFNDKCPDLAGEGWFFAPVEEWLYVPFIPELPQQQNGYDCGIFLIEYLRHLFIQPSRIKTLLYHSVENKTQGKVPMDVVLEPKIGIPLHPETPKNLPSTPETNTEDEEGALPVKVHVLAEAKSSSDPQLKSKIQSWFTQDQVTLRRRSLRQMVLYMQVYPDWKTDRTRGQVMEVLWHLFNTTDVQAAASDVIPLLTVSDLQNEALVDRLRRWPPSLASGFGSFFGIAPRQLDADVIQLTANPLREGRRLSGSSIRQPSMSPCRRPSASPIIRQSSVSPDRQPSVSPAHRRAANHAGQPSVSLVCRPTVSLIRRSPLSPVRQPSESPARRLSMGAGRIRSVDTAHRTSVDMAFRPSLSSSRGQPVSLRRHPSGRAFPKDNVVATDCRSQPPSSHRRMPARNTKRNLQSQAPETDLRELLERNVARGREADRFAGCRSKRAKDSSEMQTASYSRARANKLEFSKDTRRSFEPIRKYSHRTELRRNDTSRFSRARAEEFDDTDFKPRRRRRRDVG